MFHVHAQPFRSLAGLGVIGLRQNDQKLLSPISDQPIQVVTNTGLNCLGKGNQHVIATQMTVQVVDLLEVIQIAQNNGERMAVSTCTGHFLLQGLGQKLPVVTPGQGIDGG